MLSLNYIENAVLSCLCLGFEAEKKYYIMKFFRFGSVCEGRCSEGSPEEEEDTDSGRSYIFPLTFNSNKILVPLIG